MPGILLLVGATVTLAITLFAPRRLMQSPRTALVAGVPLAAAVLMTIYVFGEDSYVGDGTSRWVRYNGGAHTLYAVAIALDLLGALVVVVAVVRGAPGWTRAGLAVSSFACVGSLIAVIGFTVN